MIRLIVAFDSRQGIAKNGSEPWNLPVDRAYFAETTKTKGATILMGSTTFKVIGRPLPDRINYVLTSKTEPVEGIRLVHDLDDFLSNIPVSDIWIIGGASVYKQALETDKVDEIYATEIEADFGCDQFFPAFKDRFKLISQNKRQQADLNFSFCVYAKS